MMLKIAILLLFSCSLWAQEKTFSNLKYGPHERNVYDLWIPKVQSWPSPVVIFIHGGGFVSGDKDNILKHPEFIKNLNDHNYAVASINYRFLEHTSLQNIMKEDIAGFVQHIRYNAKKYNLHKVFVFSLGSSAGGSASLWLGTHDDLKDPEHKDPVKRESTRLYGFAHLNAQAGYDFLDWFDYFGKETTTEFLKDQIWSRYHLKTLEDLESPEGVLIRQDLDSVENMDEDDAPMFLYNSYAKKEKSDWDYDYFIHGPQHANVLAKRAKEVGLHRSVHIKVNGNDMPTDLYKAVTTFFRGLVKKANGKK